MAPTTSTLDAPGPHFQCSVGADFSIPGIGVDFQGYFADNGKSWKLEAEATHFPSLRSLLGDIKAPGLSILPDVQIDRLQAEITPETASISTSATVNGAVPLDGHTDIQFAMGIKDLTCTIGYKPKIEFLDCAINLSGSLSITDFLSIEIQDLQGSYLSEKKEWNLTERQIVATFLGVTLNFNVTYVGNENGESLTLELDNPGKKKLIDLPNIFSFGVDSFTITISKTGESWQIVIQSTARLTLNGCPEISGTLGLCNSQIFFKPHANEFDFGPVYFFDHGPLKLGVSAKLTEISISWGSASAGIKADSEWTIHKTGLPKFLVDTLPDVVQGSLSIDEKTGLSLSLTNDSALKPFKIPVGNLEDLGKAVFQLHSLSITVGKTVSATLGVAIGLPENLNDIFGKNNLDLFLTFPKTFDILFTLGVDPFVASIQFDRPPILPHWFDDEKQANADEGTPDAWHLVLGENGKYGKIKIGPPLPYLDYKLEKFAFSTGGAFEVESALKIPLIPFQNLLALLICVAGTGSTKVTPEDKEKAAKFIPDALPIPVINFLGSDGKLNINALMTLMDDFPMNPDVKTEIEGALTTFKKFVDAEVQRLPDSLLPYLKAEFPPGLKGLGLSWEISVRDDGSVNLDVNTAEDKPFLMLWPVPDLPPMLYGITFRGFSFGTLCGDSLFELKVDCDLDQFDLISLAIALAVPDEPGFPITHNFTQHLHIKNLVTLIEYETEIPIPIPVYFEELGIEYLDILGFGLQAHASIEKPTISIKTLTGVLSLLENVRDFFKCPSVRLDPTKLGDLTKFLPTFTANDWYLQFPEWIAPNSAGYLGKKGEIFNSQNLGKEMLTLTANLLNTIKFFNIVSLVNAIPNSYRTGEVLFDSGKPSLKFAGLELKADCAWLFTTPEDFNANLAQYHDIIKDTQAIQKLMTLALGPDYAKALAAVCVVETEVDVGNLAGLALRFALVSSGRPQAGRTEAANPQLQSGIATALHLKGNIGILHAEAMGLLVVSQSKSEGVRFTAKGQSKITFGPWELFESSEDIEIDNTGFTIDGTIRLLPEGSPFSLTADAHCSIHSSGTDSDIDIRLHENVKIEGFDKFGLASSSADFIANNHEVALTITFLGALLKLEAKATNTSITFTVQENAFANLSSMLLVTTYDIVHKTLNSNLTGTVIPGTTYEASIASSGSGKLQIWMAGVSLFQLNINISGTSYAISGSLDLIPIPNPLFALRIVVSNGSLSNAGINFSGTTTLSIAGFDFKLTLTFSPASIKVGGSVQYKTWWLTLPAVGASGGLFVDKNKPVVCVAFTAFGVTTYAIASASGPSIQWSPPTYWPKTGVLEPLPAETQSRPPLVDGMALLDLVKNLHKEGVLCCGSAEEFAKLGPLFEKYDLRIQMTEGRRTKLGMSIEAHRPMDGSDDPQMDLFRHIQHGAQDYATQHIRPESQDAFLKEIEAIDRVILTGDVGGVDHVQAAWQESETESQIMCEFDYTDFDKHSKALYAELAKTLTEK